MSKPEFLKSLKTRVLLLALAIILAGVWALATRLTAVLQSDFEKLLAEQLSATVGYVATEIDAKIKFRVDTLQQIAASITPDIQADPVKVQRLLETSNFSTALFPAGLVVANGKGTYIADYPRVAGRVGGYIGDRKYFLEAMAGAGLSMSEPLMGRFLKKPVVTFAVPLRSAAGYTAGALVHSISPSDHDLFGRLEETKIGSTGRFVVISPRDDLVVWSSDKSQILTPPPAKGVNPLFDRRRYEGYEGAGITATSLGVEQFSVSRNMKSTGWIVIAAIPTAEIFAPIAALKRQIYLATALVMLAMVAALYFVLARQLRPLAEAGTAMGRMSSGEEPFQPLPIRRNDEIGALVRSFNRLAIERGRLDDVLKESERRFRTIFESVHLVTAILDIEGKLVFCNHALLELTGWKRGEVIGKNWFRTFRPPEQSEGRLASYLNDIATGSIPLHYEGDVVARDGRRFVIDWSHTLMRDAEGRVTGVASIGADITERKRAEAENGRLAAIVANSNDSIVGRALDGTITSWNAGAERLYGYIAAEVIGSLTPKLIPPDKELEAATNRNLIRAGKPVRVHETARIARDGRRLDISLSMSPIKDGNGTVIGMSTIARDISDRKRADESHARLAAIVENSYDAIVSRKLDRTIDSWNSAAEELFGYSASEMIGKDLSIIIPPDRRVEASENRALVEEGHAVPLVDTVRLARDGRRIDVSMRQSPIRDASGNMIGVSVIFRDITRRKQAEAQQQLAASVFEEAAESIVITDPDRNIVSVNRAFAEITGYSAREVVGKPPRIFQSDRQTPGFYERMWASIRDTGRWKGEVWDERKDGKLYCALLSINAVRSGGTHNYCAIFSDITQKKMADLELARLNAGLELRVAQRTAELENANEELEAFSYSVSHDLRAPLRRIAGFGKLLLDNSYDRLETEDRNMVQRMLESSARMSELIEDLMNFSRTSRQRLSCHEIDLSQIARDVFVALADAHPQRRVDTIVAPAVVVSADAALMRLVMDNLLGNAWKFTGKTDNARVEVGVCTIDGETVYFVRDNGAGFDMTYARRLFTPFQRMHHESEFEGTGIGLATVKRIIRRHHGRIWIESAAGGGCTVFFTLGGPVMPA